MKHLLWFFLFFWTIGTIAAQTLSITAGLDEYPIKTQDGKCTLKYLSPVAVPADWTIYIADEGCLENGTHEVHLLDTDKVVRDSLLGYFTDGYFIGKTPLNTPIIKRFSPANGVQEAFFFIENDPALQIDYVGKMTSRLDTGVYPAFNVCEPFHLIARTENKKLFEKEETLNSLLTVVKSYAQNICPNVSTIIFDATDDLNDKTHVFSRISLQKDETGVWMPIIENSFNEQVAGKEYDRQRKQLLEQTYDLLEKLPPYDRPAFVFNQHKIDFPYQLMTASYALDIPVKGIFVIHVTRNTQQTSWADYPFILKINTPLNPGWYIVSGQVSPFSLHDKKKAGLSWTQPAAFVTLADKKECRKANCAEWENTFYLMEQKYGVSRSDFLSRELSDEK